MTTQPRRWQIAGVTIPLGPIGLRIGVHRRGALAVAVGFRRWLR
jgi:hypothetical protein